VKGRDFFVHEAFETVTKRLVFKREESS